MEFEKLLRGFDCACGRRHTCPIRYVAVQPGAISRLAELAAPHDAILLVADENTYAAAGAQAERALAGKALRRRVFPGAPLLVPDERAIEAVTDALDGVNLIVAVGSGVIQDICKYVSFFPSASFHNLPLSL